MVPRIFLNKNNMRRRYFWKRKNEHKSRKVVFSEWYLLSYLLAPTGIVLWATGTSLHGSEEACTGQQSLDDATFPWLRLDRKGDGQCSDPSLTDNWAPVFYFTDAQMFTAGLIFNHSHCSSLVLMKNRFARRILHSSQASVWSLGAFPLGIHYMYNWEHGDRSTHRV